jgi:hypothetical protein
MGRTFSARGYNKHGGVKDNTEMNLGKVKCECRLDSRGSECGSGFFFVEQGDELFRSHKRRIRFDYLKSRRFCVGLVTLDLSTSRLESNYFQFDS